MRFVFASLILSGVLACNGGDRELICTQIGCGDAVSISFPDWPDGAYTMEVTADGRAVRQSCTSSQRKTFEGEGVVGVSGGPCGISIPGTPEVIRVRFSGAHGTVTRTIRPGYEDYRPNGPRCEPVCRGAAGVFRPEG